MSDQCGQWVTGSGPQMRIFFLSDSHWLRLLVSYVGDTVGVCVVPPLQGTRLPFPRSLPRGACCLDLTQPFSCVHPSGQCGVVGSGFGHSVV